MPDTRPSIALFPARLATRLRARGASEIAGLAIQRVRDNLSSSDTLVVLVRPAEGPPAAQEGLLFRVAEPGDGARYAHDIGTDSADSFRRRLSARTRCFVVELEGRLVHASWVTTAAAWTREVRAFMKPPPGDAYVYESFTRADARGRGVYPYALRNVCAALGSEGVGNVWVAVEADNIASVKAVTKANFREAFRISYSRKLGHLRIEDPSGPQADIGRTFIKRNL